MLRYYVLLKCEVEEQTLQAAELCDPEVCSGGGKHCMLQNSVILKCEVEKNRHRKLRYFVILD